MLKYTQKDFLIKDGFYNPESEAFRITARILDAFTREVIANDALPVILIFPNAEDIERYAREGTKQYAPLLSTLDRLGYPYVDLMGAFPDFGKRYGLDDLFAGHYTRMANERVAEFLADYLVSNRLTEPQAVTQARLRIIDRN